MYKKLKRLFIAVAFLMFTITFSLDFAFAAAVKKAPEIVQGFPMLSKNDFTITWLPVVGAVKYKLYVNGKNIAETHELFFTDIAPEEPGEYKITVTGVDVNGLEGPSSKEGIITIVKLTQPAGFRFEFLRNMSNPPPTYPLNISWQPVQTAIRYDIYRSTKEDGDFEFIDSTQKATYIDFDVMQSKNVGNTFYYKIVVRDKFDRKSPDTETHEVKVGRVILIPH